MESKASAGYPFNRTGRASRAEKFFGATATKNVLGRISLPLRRKNMSQYKVVVYVPVESADSVREAIANVGAGKSEKYSHASFSSRGIGRFKPLSGARPAIGAVGKLEEVEEEKIEVTCDGEILNAVIAAIRRAHPYEDPAIDAWEIKAS